jgi:hypothetical protein
MINLTLKKIQQRGINNLLKKVRLKYVVIFRRCPDFLRTTNNNKFPPSESLEI